MPDREPEPQEPELQEPEILDPRRAPQPEIGEMIEHPAKLLRIASMIRELLEEVRRSSLDEAGRQRLREIHERALSELKGTLSEDLQRELSTLAIPMDRTPSESELRVAQAQLVGWLEGLFHGIQAALWAQQMHARAQLEEMRRRALPGGPQGREGQKSPGQYL